MLTTLIILTSLFAVLLLVGIFVDGNLAGIAAVLLLFTGLFGWLMLGNAATVKTATVLVPRERAPVDLGTEILIFYTYKATVEKYSLTSLAQRSMANDDSYTLTVDFNMYGSEIRHYPTPRINVEASATH